MANKSVMAEIQALSASNPTDEANPITQGTEDESNRVTQGEGQSDQDEANRVTQDIPSVRVAVTQEDIDEYARLAAEKRAATEVIDVTLEASSDVAIIPEIDGFEGTLVGEAVRKDFIPGQIYFDYRTLLNSRVAKATNPDERRAAIFNSQVWLLCQCYEVVEPNGKTRPLGLDDVDCMDGETLAFTVSNLVVVDIDINFLDEKNSLEYSELFEVTERAQRFKIERLTVEKAVEIQELSREDPTGIKLSQWMICNKIRLNNERIKLEDFKDKLDLTITVVLVQKADFLLKPYLQKRKSFTIRDTRAGTTKT